jgi:hypothetical protein
MSSGAGGAVQQPYIPTDAEQAEHLQNLIRKLKEFWVEQLAEMETLSLATEQVRECGCGCGCVMMGMDSARCGRREIFEW